MDQDELAESRWPADDAEEGQPRDPVDILPLAEDTETPIPALRDVRAQIMKLGDNGLVEPARDDADDDDNKTVVVLADPEGLAPEPAVLSTAAFALASLFDGRRSARQVAAELGAQVNQPVAPENVLELQRKLDEALLLYSKRFERTVRRQLRSYLEHNLRPAVHAGAAYPAAADELQQAVTGYFTADDGPGAPWTIEPSADAPTSAAPAAKQAVPVSKPVDDTLRSLILPHIDLRVGGATYAHGYAQLLQHCEADLFVILGVAHQSDGNSLYYVSQKDFATPLGPARTERGIARRLQAAAQTEPVLAELAHRTEHSVEFQAILLAALMARCGRGFEIVPVLCGPVEAFLATEASPLAAAPFGNFAGALRRELDASKRKWCVLCSVDLSHVGPEFGNATAMTPRLLPPMERYDRRLLEIMARLDAQGVCDEIARTQNSRHVDAVMAVLTMLQTCQGLIKRGRLLHYDQMLKDGTHSAVSFAAMAFDSG